MDSRSDNETARKEHDLDVRAATPDRNDKSSPVLVTVTPKGDDKTDDTTGAKSGDTTGTVTVLRDAPDHRSATGSVRAAAGDTITVASVNDDGTVSRATHVVTKDDVAKANGKADGKTTSTTGTSKDTSKDAGQGADKDATSKDGTSPAETSKDDSKDDAKDDSKDDSKDATASTDTSKGASDGTTSEDGALDLDTPKDPDVTADQLKAFLDALDRAHKAGKVTDGTAKAAAEAAARNPHADDAVKRAASGIVDAIGKADAKADDKKDDGNKDDTDTKTDGGNGNGTTGTSDKPANGANGGQTATPAPSKPTNNGSNGNGTPKPRVWVETRPAWTEIVHHDAVTHVERVKVRDAWDETKRIPVWEVRDDAGGSWIFYSGDEASAFMRAEVLKGHATHVSQYWQTKTVHHDAEYQNRTVTDKPAWDERINHPAEGYWK